MATVANLKNSAYWQKRFEQLEDAENKISAKTLKEVEGYYNEAIRQIELDIEKWYRRFAKNNNISMADARQWLAKNDLAELKWDVKEYIKAGKENAVTQQWMKELENASSKFHISKLESLKLKTQNSLEQLYAKYHTAMTGAMKNVYTSGYYHTAYELQKGLGVGWDISGLDQKQIEKIISKPWAVDGVNFSERIWGNKDKLIQTIHNELTQNVMIGGDVDKAINNIAKTMNTSKSNAARLVLTEGAYFHSVSQKDSYTATGVTKYEILATLDTRTTEICRTLDGEVYEVKDMQAGLTAPPFHVRCRSTTVPYFDDDFGVPGERAARDEETGQTYYIPDDIKYKEWEQTFVNGGDKSAFEVIDFEGLTHYKKPVTAEPPKPKKEYLTKKKLIANIANADVEIEELEKQLQQATGQAEADLQTQITALEAQKSDWQAKLDEKLKAEQVKALKKQELDLENQINGFTQKTYSGIWKDNVTTADWSAKQNGIAAKKKYFEDKLATETDPAEIAKWQGLLDDLAEFDAQGKALNDLKVELKKVKSNLTTLKNPNGVKQSPFTPDAYSQRKTDAWNKRFATKEKADAYYRPILDNEWDNLTEEEKFAVWQYTHNSHPINRPLSGYLSWGDRSNFVGLNKLRWKRENDAKEAILNSQEFKKKFANAKNPYGDPIRDYTDVIGELTQAIEKVELENDAFLVRGSNVYGLAGLLDGNVISYQEAENLLNAGKLTELLNKVKGKRFQTHSFTSTGIAQGSGFNGDITYRIYAPKGTKAIFAEPQSFYGNTIHGEEIYKKGKAYSSVGREAEIIIQRGTTFRVTDIERKGSGYLVHMEVVEQPDYFKTGYEHTFDDGLTSEK